MGFPQKEAEQLLVACQRHCCICHKRCGVKIQLHHIEFRAVSENDSIDNAIPVCLECHAEIALYNLSHPIGRRFTPGELKLHKERWLQICERFPCGLPEPSIVTEMGTITGLRHEINFDLELARHSRDNEIGCPFQVAQFDRALADGTCDLINEELRTRLFDAYRCAKRVNTFIEAMLSDVSGANLPDTRIAVQQAREPFEALEECLRSHLSVD